MGFTVPPILILSALLTIRLHPLRSYLFYRIIAVTGFTLTDLTISQIAPFPIFRFYTIAALTILL